MSTTPTRLGDPPQDLREIDVLLVEDNPGDVRLIQEGFSRGSVPVDLTVTEDGDEAWARLTSGSPPDLVLLDLNLPGLSGHELLARLKEDPELKEIPVVILTTSDDRDDLLESYRLQAAGFITKPVDPSAFIAAIEDLGLYWSGVVQLPP